MEIFKDEQIPNPNEKRDSDNESLIDSEFYSGSEDEILYKDKLMDYDRYMAVNNNNKLF